MVAAWPFDPGCSIVDLIATRVRVAIAIAIGIGIDGSDWGI
jgi:hypothetical protein